MPKLAAGLCFAFFLLLAASSPGTAADDPGEALRSAATAGDLAKVKELLAAGVDVDAANSYGGTALAFAAKKGHVEIVDLLLERGADVNAADTFYGNTPIAWAAHHGHTAVVRSLLAKGATGESMALTTAIEEGHGDLVKLLLGRGRIDAETLSDALLFASQVQRPEMAALLEAAGARPLVPVALDPAVLKSYEGTYEGAFNGEDFSMTVTAGDGKLTLSSDGRTFTFLATDPVTFKAEGILGLKIVFQVEEGKVRGMSLLQGQGTTQLTRKEAP